MTGFGVAKMLWHFSVVPAGSDRSVLTVIGRLRCTGDDVQRLLVLWDAFERLRARAHRELLQAIKARAESSGEAAGRIEGWD